MYFMPVIDLLLSPFRANMCTTERENTQNGGKRDERKNGKADSGSEETDHRGYYDIGITPIIPIFVKYR